MKNTIVVFLSLIVFLLSGCSYIQKARRTDNLERENANLRSKIEELEKEKSREVKKAVKEKERKLSDLEQAKRELEESLKQEIGQYKAKLEMTERGLVITFLSEVFFDSGKDTVKQTGRESLEKVALVLNENVPDSYVAVEGHTDNQPIKYSGWKTNWELSSARALAVLHCLVNEAKVKPERLSANGYGEYRPVSNNDTTEGNQKNRRVEIIILPSKISKIRTQ